MEGDAGIPVASRVKEYIQMQIPSCEILMADLKERLQAGRVRHG
jgi:hypothetical protein